LKSKKQGNLNYNLLLRGNTYYVDKAVPPRLIPLLGGKDKIRISLRVTKVSEAWKKRKAALDDIDDMFEAARGRLKGDANTDFTFNATQLAEAKKLYLQAQRAMKSGNDSKWSTVVDSIDEKADRLDKRHGKSVGTTFHLTGHGSTPIMEHVETWLEEKRYTDRTKADARTAIKRLLKWLTKNEKSLTIHMHKTEAAQFKLTELQKSNPKTANKLLSCLRAYWKWLVGHGIDDVNPWAGLSFPKPKMVPKDERERAFTDDEVVRLFAGNLDRMMRDVMAIGALSGLRLEEIFQLRIKDCPEDIFKVLKSKTPSGVRDVPIHSALVETIVARCANKGPEDFLIHEGKPTGWEGSRSMAFSKRFATYRVACGVDQKLQGHRRSKVNFHSWRRYAITKADQAGKRRDDIERTFGHKPQGMSLGTYSEGLLKMQMREVIESITLPAGVAVFDCHAREFQYMKPKLRTKRGQIARLGGAKKQTPKSKKLNPKAKNVATEVSRGRRA
jgi:integrase